MKHGILMIPLCGEPQDTVDTWGSVICVLQIVPLLVSLVPVEIGLRRNFTRNGNRKHE